MTIQRMSALAVLVAGVGIAHADTELTSTATLTTDYDFRGVTQTAQDPALQASLDLAFDSGLYLGAWGSNVDFGDDTASDVEIDIYAGFAGGITETLGYDLGAVFYFYVDDDDDIDYAEFYAGLDYQILSTKFWYAPDYLDSNDSAYYLEANLAGDSLPWGLGWTAHVGYSGGDFWDDTANNGLDEYYDWSVGLTRSFGPFDVDLRWIDGSDLDEADGTGSPRDANSSEERLVLGVSTTFPWGQ